MSGKGGSEPQEDQSPANMRNSIAQLVQLGFSKEDCANALKQCHGHLVIFLSLLQIWKKLQFVIIFR